MYRQYFSLPITVFPIHLLEGMYLSIVPLLLSIPFDDIFQTKTGTWRISTIFPIWTRVLSHNK